MRKRLLALALVFAMACTLLPLASLAADSSTGDVTSVTVGESIEGELTNEVQEIFYQVSLPSAGRFSFTLDGAIRVIRGTLIDSNGSSLWSEYREKNSNSGHAVVGTSMYLTEGTYYIKVNSLYKGTHFTGTYSLTTDFEAVEESFPEAGTDNDMGSANEIEFDKTYQGFLPYNVDEDQDFYKVTLPSAGRLSFTLDGEIYVIRGAVIDSNGSSLRSEYRKKNSNTGHAVVETSLDLTEGTYYIKVNSLYQSGYFSGTYSLTTSFKVAEDPSPETEPEMVTVTLKTGNGDKKVETEKGQPMKAPTDPTKEGYTFGGWYTSEALKTAWSFDQKVEQSMTLYAKWTAVAPDMVTVTLKTGDSDKTVETVKGEPMKVPTNPTKEGHTFSGWYTDEALTTAWNFDRNVDRSMTLYAKWTPVSSSATQTGKSSQTITVDGKKVELDAYTLKADSNGGDVTYVKLRDVAAVLNGTQAQFDVQWLNGAIYVAAQTPYVSQNGTELKSIATKDNSFQWNTNPILFSGVIQPLEGIILIDKNEGGHTFFKLRDLGAAIGFKVDWSAEQGIFIETK